MTTGTEIIRFEVGDLVAVPRDAFLYGTEDVLRLELTKVPYPVHWLTCEYVHVFGYPVNEEGTRTGAPERRAILITQAVAGKNLVFGKVTHAN